MGRSLDALAKEGNTGSAEKRLLVVWASLLWSYDVQRSRLT